MGWGSSSPTWTPVFLDGHTTAQRRVADVDYTDRGGVERTATGVERWVWVTQAAPTLVCPPAVLSSTASYPLSRSAP